MNAKHRSLGEHIRAEREAAGLSIRQLAHQAGIHFSYLASLEKDKYRASAEVVIKLAETLHIDAEPLLAHLGIHQPLPEPRAYFRRKLGVNAKEADVLAQLIEDYQAKNTKEGGENHDET
jgi:transcriptional regulator with XRE-family HTH domain